MRQEDRALSKRVRATAVEDRFATQNTQEKGTPMKITIETIVKAHLKTAC